MLSAYVHVPFCAARCGYCDFNTYVPGRAGLSPAAWLDALRAETLLAASSLTAEPGPLSTVFFGGGTPTLLGAGPLIAVLQALRQAFGLAPGAEVTVEANPETLTDALLDALLAGGVTRLSLGMQSADEAVLAVLDRAHTPGQAVAGVEAAHRAGFTDVSLDLIYGTPGETIDSWASTLQAALAVEPEHVSCYSLIVEPGTPLARRIGAGALPAPDDDLMADEYVLADETLSAAGLGWYELSNWAKGAGPGEPAGHECRHNLAYWWGLDWWGFGPGAHSHIGRRRWWNHRSPAVWAGALRAGKAPEAGSELVDDTQAHEERVLLELRLATGLPCDALTPAEAARVPALIDDGLLETRDTATRLSRPSLGSQVKPVADGEVLVLTRRGRLLADLVTRQLLD